MRHHCEPRSFNCFQLRQAEIQTTHCAFKSRNNVLAIAPIQYIFFLTTFTLLDEEKPKSLIIVSQDPKLEICFIIVYLVFFKERQKKIFSLSQLSHFDKRISVFSLYHKEQGNPHFDPWRNRVKTCQERHWENCPVTDKQVRNSLLLFHIQTVREVFTAVRKTRSKHGDLTSFKF